MLTSRFLFIIFIFSSIITSANAQEQSNYTLLWKIENKITNKPSYLFGTMHVDDERVFNFSDAVMPAIQNTEKFALEVQPDSLMYLLNMKFIKNTKPSYLYFKKLLSEQEYDSVKQRFKEVNGYNLEESTISDPNVLLELFNPENNKNTDKSTFVDMYLLRHAKTMNKKIIGLENINSQLNYFENATKEKQREMILEIIKYSKSDYLKELEGFTKVYLTGDINAIHKKIMSKPEGYGEEMKKRNIVITNSIIKEMHNSSIFCAVGAAHLPGNIGLIKMLQDKGYTVTPVKATFTGIANKYKIDISKMSWHTFYEKNYGYQVDTPGISYLESIEDNVNTYSYYDLITSTNYSHLAIDFRHMTSLNKKDFYTKLIENASIQYNGEVIEENKIKIDGKEGHILTLKLNTKNNDNNGFKYAFIYNNGIFYQFMIFDKLENLNNENVKRFFNSVKINKPKELKKIEEKEEWQLYTNKKGAFSINLPKKPKEITKEVKNPADKNSEPYILNLYIATDLKNSSNYIVRYNDLPNGYYINSLDTYFNEMKSDLTNKAKLLKEPIDINYNNCKGKQYDLMFANKYHAICKILLRGNRTYMLLSQTLIEGEKVNPDNTFFSSFKMLNFQEENDIILQEHENFNYKTFKNNETIDDYEVNNDPEYYFGNSKINRTKNENTGDLYLFNYTKLKPYFKIDTLKNFYNTNKENIITRTDTILNSKSIKIDNLDGIEFTVMNKKDSLYSKHLFWLDNSMFFYKAAYTSKENLNSKLTNKILYSYKSKKNSAKFDYFKSKSELIFKDLKSKDTTIYKNALGAFYYYEFSEKDIPLFYKAVDEKYAMKKNKNEVIKHIVHELVNINDEETLNFLENLYKNHKLNEDIKHTIIKNIYSLENKNNLKTYKYLLFNNPPKVNVGYYTFLPFYDSIPMAIENYKSLITLNHSKSYREQLLNLSTNILTSKNENKNTIVNYYKTLTDSISKDLKSYEDSQKETDDYNYKEHTLIYYYLNYIAKIPKDEKYTKLINSFTSPLLKINANKWMTSKAAQTRIVHNLKLPKTIKKQLLDSLDTRYDLMNAYHKSNRFNEISKILYNEENFANLSLNQYLYDADEYPISKTLLGKIIVNSKTYYSYALSYDNEDDKKYLVVVKANFKVSQENEYKQYDVYTNWEQIIMENWKIKTKELINKTNKE